MEAWTPEGDLLVSEPANGRIVELKPGAGGTASTRTLLSGLTSPQGMAFARLSGHWVLYVGESDRIDRYPWGARGIGGARTVIAAHLPGFDPAGDDVHPYKDIAVAPDGTLYFDVGSSSNANPGDRTMKPPRAVIMAMRPDGSDLHVVEKGVRNGEGLAVAPNGTVWTAVNNRDNIPYPFHKAYGGYKDAFGKVIQAYVNNHPPDEVLPVTQGRDLGWPYCNPDQDLNHPAGSLANVPFVADAVDQPRRPPPRLRQTAEAPGRAPSAQRPARSGLPGGQQDPRAVVRGRRRGRARFLGPSATPRPRGAVDGVERREAHPGTGGRPDHWLPERRRQPLGPARRRRPRPRRRAVRQRRHRRRHLPPHAVQLTGPPRPAEK